jgi:hypothetical protein
MAYIGMAGVISYLREHIDDASFDLEGSFEPIEGKNGETAIGAADGGSGIVWDGSSFIIGAYRSGFRLYKKGELLRREISDVSVCIAQNQKHLDFMREEEELKRLKELSEELDGIILVDGILPEVEIPNSVGISKSTNRSLDGYPVSPLIMREGKKLFPNEPWCYTGEEGIFALFHPLSRYLFRLEFSSEDLTHQLKELLSYCNDPIYLGYPYPLALIHNDVAITYETVADVLYDLQREEPSLLKVEGFHRRLDENLW